MAAFSRRQDQCVQKRGDSRTNLWRRLLFRALARSQISRSRRPLSQTGERNLRAFLLLECIWQRRDNKDCFIVPRIAVAQEKLAAVPFLPESRRYRLSRTAEQIARSAHWEGVIV